MINRLKIVIRNEKEIEARSYIELGKYYFENLRDASNERTEPLCAAAENADRRLKRAFAKLDEIMAPSGDQEEESGDGAEDESDGGDFFRSFTPSDGKGEETGESADDDPTDDPVI